MSGLSIWGWEFSIGSSGLGDEDRLKTAFVLGYRACLVFLASLPVSRAIAWGFAITSSDGIVSARFGKGLSVTLTDWFGVAVVCCCKGSSSASSLIGIDVLK